MAPGSWLRSCASCLARLLLQLIVVAIITGRQPVGRAAAETEDRPPLSIGVVVDVHPHQQPVVDFERQVIDSLGRTLEGTATNVFVVGYSNRVQLVQDWSPGGPALAAASAHLAVDEGGGVGRGAALNDGLMEAVMRLRASTAGSSRALIVIGEGNDGASQARFGDVLDAARAGNIRCFALLVATHRSQVGRVRQFGFDLYRLAGGTGGRLRDVRIELTSAGQRDVGPADAPDSGPKGPLNHFGEARNGLRSLRPPGSIHPG